MPTSRVSIRIPTPDLAEIDRRAKARHMTRTAYMLGAALSDGLLKTASEAQCDELGDELDAVTARLERLEQVTFGGGA